MTLRNNGFERWLLALVLPVLMIACKKDKNNCAMKACTYVFISVTVKVTDTLNQAVLLDDAYTIRKSNGELITQAQGLVTAGYYAVLNDSYQHRIANTSEFFQFIGVKNGRRVVDEVYEISADCCHIQKVNGKESIIINP